MYSIVSPLTTQEEFEAFQKRLKSSLFYKSANYDFVFDGKKLIILSIPEELVKKDFIVSFGEAPIERLDIVRFIYSCKDAISSEYFPDKTAKYIFSLTWIEDAEKRKAVFDLFCTLFKESLFYKSKKPKAFVNCGRVLLEEVSQNTIAKELLDKFSIVFDDEFLLIDDLLTYCYEKLCTMN